MNSSAGSWPTCSTSIRGSRPHDGSFYGLEVWPYPRERLQTANIGCMAAVTGQNHPLQTAIPAVVFVVGHGSEDVTVACGVLRGRGHTVKGPMSVASLHAPGTERPDCIVADLRPPVELSA